MVKQSELIHSFAKVPIRAEFPEVTVKTPLMDSVN